MDRFSYVTRNRSVGWSSGTVLVFEVLDRQRRSDEPIAVCNCRDDAERIVEALNRAQFDYGIDWGDPAGDYSAEWPLK